MEFSVGTGPEKPNRECWAACLGDCSDKMTNEHIFTQAVFPNDDVWVQGFHWCRDLPQLIGLANLTKKVLCSKHNFGLSGKADAAAVSMARAFRESVALQDFRSKYRPTNWTRKQFKIPGFELESWFLKTLININFKRPQRIGRHAIEPGAPCRGLVEIAFGLRRFVAPAGLYIIAKVGDQNPTDGRLRVVTLSKGSDYIAGAIFHFGGLKSLLYLDDDGRPCPENFVGHGDATVLESQFMYRLRRTRFVVHNRLSHTIDFQW
jgi:hypothetical protein